MTQRSATATPVINTTLKQTNVIWKMIHIKEEKCVYLTQYDSIRPKCYKLFTGTNIMTCNIRHIIVRGINALVVSAHLVYSCLYPLRVQFL